MKNIQSFTRIIGFIAVFVVIIGQFFKSETQFIQAYLPYLIILALVMLSISFFLKIKTDGVKDNSFKIKFILFFIAVVISGLILIYQLTT